MGLTLRKSIENLLYLHPNRQYLFLNRRKLPGMRFYINSIPKIITNQGTIYNFSIAVSDIKVPIL